MMSTRRTSARIKQQATDAAVLKDKPVEQNPTAKRGNKRSRKTPADLPRPSTRRRKASEDKENNMMHSTHSRPKRKRAMPIEEDILPDIFNATKVPHSVLKPTAFKTCTVEQPSSTCRPVLTTETTSSDNDDSSAAVADVVPMKTLRYKGTCPIDEENVECEDDYHVVSDDIGPYHSMLNQTNIAQNNNKYYLTQLIKHNSRVEYCIWFRWGRVGKIAGMKLDRYGPDLENAKTIFENKFFDKTKNLWKERKNFVKHANKYELLEMDFGDDEALAKAKEEEERKRKERAKNEKKEQTPCTLAQSVQDVMKILFDISEFEESVKEMQYDSRKCPLGKLTSKQILAGFDALKQIEAFIKERKIGSGLAKVCSDFYTRVPHDFGMRCPPIIRNPAQLKEKLELLQALTDIQIALKILDETDRDLSSLHPIDRHYIRLKCDITPLPHTSKDYDVIRKYVSNTHAPTHNTYKLKIEDIFQLNKDVGDEQLMDKIGNRMLLWHGSRLTNWCGILQQGLRIAPPEAPTVGYMFGKGIYFADMVSKSANYCFASLRQPVGFLLLCEVALGNYVEKMHADYAGDELPKGKHSTKGVGKTQPKPDMTEQLEDGTPVPIGLPVYNTSAADSSLLYNEFVVYNINQVKLKYLVKVHFDFQTVQLW